MTMPPESPRRRLLPVFDVTEKVAVRQPVPPKLPMHPDMRAASQQWVREVQELAQLADAAMTDAKKASLEGKQRRQLLKQKVVDGCAAVDAEVTTALRASEGEIRSIEAALHPLSEEVVRLLQARGKATEKVTSIERPLKLLQKRICSREADLPAEERFHDRVERTLHTAAACLRDAAASLTALVTKCEGLVAHMHNIRSELQRGLEDKRQLLSVNRKCFSKEPVTADSFKTPGAAFPACSSNGNDHSDLALPTLAAATRSGRANPRVPRGNVAWAVDASREAIGESAALRMHLSTASKNIDRVIATNVGAVDAAFAQKVKDAVALRDVLDQRIGAMQKDVAQLAKRRSALQSELAALHPPLQDALLKNSGRKLAIPLREVRSFDSIRDATGEEIKGIRATHSEVEKQLAQINEQEKKAVALLRELETARARKDEVIAIDTAVAQMASTPVPPLSSRSARSASATSSERTSTRDSARASRRR